MAEEVVQATSDEEHSAQAETSWEYSADVADDVFEPGAAPKRSWWSRLVRLLVGEWVAGGERLERLNQAIMRQPGVPVNYVLRGELYMQAGEPELAAEDFETALELAAAQFEREDWGILAQVMRDRAGRDLELARRRLKKR